MSSAVVLWVSITMNTAVLVCSGPRCAARRGRIVCRLISPTICKSPLQQAAPSDEPRDTSRLSTPSHTSRVPEQQWRQRVSFSAHSTLSPWHIHSPNRQEKTHTAALAALRKSVALGCKKAASWQPTKAPPLWTREMREDGMEVNALRVDSDCSFLLVNYQLHWEHYEIIIQIIIIQHALLNAN